MKLSFFIIFIIFTSNILAFDPEVIELLQNAIDKQTSQKKSVGITVGLIDGDRRIILNSGLSNLNQSIPMQGNEYFSIGSVTKTFTSLLLSQAIMEGRVNLDDKVKTLLQDFSGHKVGEITLRQLSSHSSGLPRNPKEFSEKGMLLPFENYKKEKLIQELKNTSLQPSGSLIYSNLGFALLGMCLEMVYRENFEHLIKNTILTPLSLDKVHPTASDDLLPLMSKKYSDSFALIPVWKDLGAFNAVGSFKANTELMLDYLYAQLNPEKTALKAAIQNSQEEIKNYGEYSLAYGWIIRNANGQKMYWHNGSTNGFLTDAYFLPSSRKAMVVYSNSGANIECVMEIFIKGDKNCLVRDIQLDEDKTLNQYQGYYLSKKHKIIIEVKNTGYGFQTIKVMKQPTAIRMFKVADDKYEFRERQGQLSFNRADNGEVSSLTFVQSDTKIFADKLN